MGHLPEFYQGVIEFEQIAQTNNEEFNLLKQMQADDLADAFVMTASEKSIVIWEREIGIVPDPSMETLEFRRKRIINRYTTKPPFTIKWLERQLAQLLGTSLIGVSRDDDVEILYVYANVSGYALLKEFEKTIEAVLPLSMQYRKQLVSKFDSQDLVYVGSTNREHIHFDIQP